MMIYLVSPDLADVNGDWPCMQVYSPYLLISKKRYAGRLWTTPEKWDKMDSKVGCFTLLQHGLAH